MAHAKDLGALVRMRRGFSNPWKITLRLALVRLTVSTRPSQAGVHNHHLPRSPALRPLEGNQSLRVNHLRSPKQLGTDRAATAEARQWFPNLIPSSYSSEMLARMGPGGLDHHQRPRSAGTMDPALRQAKLLLGHHILRLTLIPLTSTGRSSPSGITV